jgi:hypothetical protein
LYGLRNNVVLSPSNRVAVPHETLWRCRLSLKCHDNESMFCDILVKRKKNAPILGILLINCRFNFLLVDDIYFSS